MWLQQNMTRISQTERKTILDVIRQVARKEAPETNGNEENIIY